MSVRQTWQVKRITPLGGALGLLALLVVHPALAAPEGPRLVLQITVDQLRGDLPGRYRSRFGEGGFAYFWEQGTVYHDAHHEHANTETIVGHATLATGAYPALHGMVGNLWVDRLDGGLVYNVEDVAHPLLTPGGGVDSATEIDPTQRAARSDGRSPRALLVSTLADELALGTAGKARLFAVSVKDRGAVSMAGHAGKAFWFSKATGEFVTSDYYYDAYPAWVTAWNQRREAQAYAGGTWSLSGAPGDYLFGGADDQPWEMDLAGFGRRFPHAYGPGDGKYFTTLLTVSPAGDELVASFAKALLVEEGLGMDAVTDYLAVSFSSTDYVGHLFGPASLESEENLLRLDRTLADLLAFVDEKVGLEHAVVVLSADHGGPEAPGSLRQLGQSAGYVDPAAIVALESLQRLQSRYGVARPLIQRYAHPYIYLDRAAIADAGVSQAEVESAVAAALDGVPGVFRVVSSLALREGRLVDDDLNRRIGRNDHRDRSGDLYVVFEPNWFINDFDGLEVASTHGSPWVYDSYVPLAFAGGGIPARHVYRRVATVAVAPTLALLARVKPPSGSQAGPLVEVFERP